VLARLVLLLITVGMFLDAASIFLILVLLLWSIVQRHQWEPVWSGVILTLKAVRGQCTPPLAVNPRLSCRIAGLRMEDTVRWVGWRLLSVFGAMDAGKQGIALARQGQAEADKPAFKGIAASGVNVTFLSAAEREAFVKATRPVYEKWTKTIGPALVKEAETAIAARKK
jgi:hypothetical protein